MTPVRVLVAHNSYQQSGGEDAVVEAETELLRAHGHELATLRRDNDGIPTEGLGQRLRAARDCVWSADSAEAMRACIRHFRPEVVHVHNTLARLSPAIYWAAAASGVPVVQTLHNYRLACPQAMFLRAGRICQDCVGRPPLPAVAHGCYRGSRSQSLAVATMLTTHRLIGTWSRKVRRYIALSRFCRDQFVAAGLPQEKIRIKPNFAGAGSSAPPPAVPEPSDRAPGHFLYVGRLSPEKGISVLARALEHDAGLRCDVIGTGPAAPALAGLPNANLAGWQERAAVARHMDEALALVVPSIWFEPFGLVAVEAFARGLPVIAANIGSLPEIVTPGRTGLLVEPGDPQDLARKMRWALEHPSEMRRMGRAARTAHEERFSAQENYRQLVEIYQDAIADRAD
jgi:glycosyltransferase involved in cell wall biosynthesis